MSENTPNVSVIDDCFFLFALIWSCLFGLFYCRRDSQCCH